jgi:hypothetical protein
MRFPRSKETNMAESEFVSVGNIALPGKKRIKPGVVIDRDDLVERVGSDAFDSMLDSGSIVQKGRSDVLASASSTATSGEELKTRTDKDLRDLGGEATGRRKKK